MAGAVGLLWDLATVDHASPGFLRVAGAADKAATAAGRAQAKVATAGAKMSAAGSIISKRLGLPLLALGAVSVKAATDFNASMTRIQTQAGASANDVRVLTKQVLAMKGAQQGPNELARSLYHLKSVGLDNVGAMKALKVSSDLAAVGGANLEETTNALAGAWRTGIKGAKNFHDAAATVNAVIGAGNMTLEQFTAALGTGILPSAKTFGLTLKDVGSALALFTDEGVPADAAATRLRMTFSLLGAPSKAAEKQLNSIGLTGLKLANDMRKPQGLIAAIGDLRSHLEDPQFKLSLSEQAQLLSHAFGGGRSSSAILSLVNNFDVLKKKQDQVTASLGKYDDAVKTQQATPQAQFKTAVANLEKAGVLLGNQLLPLATDFAHAIAGIASGFNGLGDGTKHVIAEIGIGLLLIGPMVSLVGKLAKGIALMWAAGRGAATFIAGMRAATLSMDAMQSKAYLAGRSLRSVESAISPMSMAMIGVGTVLVGVTLAWQRHSQSIQEDKQATSEYLGVLQQTKGALNDQVVAMTTTKLATNGAYDTARKYGISLHTVTQAALGNRAALDKITQSADGAGGPLNQLATTLARNSRALHDAERQYKYTTDAAKRHTAAVARDKLTADEMRVATSRNSEALGNLSAGSHTAAAAMHTESSAAGILAGSIEKLTKSYLKARNAALGIAQSEAQFLDSLHSMKQAIDASNGSLSLHGATARAAREQLLGAAQGALAMDDGTRKGNASLLANVEALRRQAIEAGASKGSVDRLLHSLGLMPHQIKTSLHVETADAVRSIQNFVHTPWKTYVQVVTTGGHAPSGGTAQLTPASGGFIRGPGTGTSDSIPARLSNGEFVVNAAQTAKHRALLHSINRGARGFAAGGPTDDKTYRLSGAPGVGGTTYSTLHAAQNALAKAVATLNRVFGHMSRRDLPHLTAALGKTGSDVKSAFGSWLDDARKLGIGKDLRHSLAGEAGHVAHLVNVRNRDQARLQQLIANRAAEKHTVAGAARGVFDITQAGTSATGAPGISFGAITAQATQDKNLVNKWAAGIHKLKGEGFGASKTGIGMLRQLAEAGPASWPQVQALLSASPKKLTGLIATQRSIDKTATSLGGFVGGTVFGGQITAERAELRKERQRASDALDRLERRMEKFMDHPVEVELTLNGRKLASGTAKGTKQNARRK